MMDGQTDGWTEGFDVSPSLFVSPAKHGKHIGIMTQLVAVSVASHFWFLINNFEFERMHQFYSKFRGKAS